MLCVKCGKNKVFGWTKSARLCLYCKGPSSPAMSIEEKRRKRIEHLSSLGIEISKKIFRILPTGRDYVRYLVRLRDKNICQKCGKIWKVGARAFDVHHLGGLCGKKSKGYDHIDDIPNLITYCHKCHLNLGEVREKMRLRIGTKTVVENPA